MLKKIRTGEIEIALTKKDERQELINFYKQELDALMKAKNF